MVNSQTMHYDTLSLASRSAKRTNWEWPYMREWPHESATARDASRMNRWPERTLKTEQFGATTVIRANRPMRDVAAAEIN